MTAMSTEATAVVEMVRTALILAATFGIAFSADQQAAIIVFIGAAFAAVSAILAWINRNHVFSAKTAQQIANAATNLEPGTEVDLTSLTQPVGP